MVAYKKVILQWLETTDSSHQCYRIKVLWSGRSCLRRISQTCNQSDCHSPLLRCHKASRECNTHCLLPGKVSLKNGQESLNY